MIMAMAAILIISFMIFASMRTLKACQFFQQTGYSAADFMKFIFKRAQFIDKKLSVALFFYSALSTGFKNYYVDTAVMAGLFILAALNHTNPLKISMPKKKFELTKRARRIMNLAIAIELWLTYALFSDLAEIAHGTQYCMCRITGLLILLVQAPPFILMLSNFFLSPFEAILKRHYYEEAKKKIRLLNPVVIGITGSFGKTSTKNILHHILSQKDNALMTSRSINTLFGIVRVIREELLASHKYFIAEIGTSMPGRIARICSLVRPGHAILTAVGNMHYAYFKTNEAVAKEKFSIFKTVLEKDGIAVVNGLQVEEKYIREFLGGYENAFVLSEEKEDGRNYKIENARITRNGVAFTLSYGGRRHEISAPVYGIHQAKDIALSFIMANKLGMDAAEITKAISTLPQLKDRQYVEEKDGVMYIRDAYNSNLDGFMSALDTLTALAGEGGRRILVTPGMLELGKLHDEYHRKVAMHALKNADIAIALLPERIAAFVDTFKKGMGAGQQVVSAHSHKDVEQWMKANLKKGDTVLFENDLADIYVEKISI
jgi:UDP-N-acetylmuramoyl-tripeptide--D-alanyl-D-alanine ligase